jgi:hypothetical protein
MEVSHDVIVHRACPNSAHSYIKGRLWSLILWQLVEPWYVVLMRLEALTLRRQLLIQGALT